jgi:hypothetical protein
MALVHESFTVGTTPLLIVSIPEGNPSTEVKLINDDNGTIYIGDYTVATSGSDKGLPVKKDSVYVLTLNAEDKLYAVAAVQTTAYALSVLYSKVV